MTRGFSRGFGRRRSDDGNVPPGQYLVDGFPVLTAGPTPRVDLDTWTLTATDETAANATLSWTWRDFRALPAEDVTTDIHCVTRWSKLGTRWRGVSVDTLLEPLDTDAGFAAISCYGGYTTNLPVEDLVDGKAWVAYEYDGEPLDAEHGGPARLLVPHLYLWKSAKWVRGLRLVAEDEPGFWEQAGYHLRGDPWQEQRYWGD